MTNYETFLFWLYQIVNNNWDLIIILACLLLICLIFNRYIIVTNKEIKDLKANRAELIRTNAVRQIKIETLERGDIKELFKKIIQKDKGLSKIIKKK